MQIKNSQTYLLRLSQNQIPRGSAFVNPTTDWKIFTQQRAWFSTLSASTSNRFGLKFYDVKNYSDVTFPTHPTSTQRGVSYWHIDNNKNFGLIYWGWKLLPAPHMGWEVLVGLIVRSFLEESWIQLFSTKLYLHC